jgi:transcriptional regulator with XRE-family HTH domain
METTIVFLNQLRDRAGSDRKAAPLVGVSQQAFSRWRQKKDFPTDDNARAIARVLNLDPAHVVAVIYAERAKNSDTRAMWERIAATFGKAAGAAALAIGAGLVAPSPAQAAFNISPFSAQSGAEIHIVSKRRRPRKHSSSFAQALASTLGINSQRAM